MTRIDTVAMNFTASLAGITVCLMAANQAHSTFLAVSSVITLLFAAVNGFYFIKGALLYIREGEPVDIPQEAQPDTGTPKHG